VPGLVLPAVRVAAVQAAPAFLDLAANLDKVDALVAEAAGRGAGPVASGEASVPGFPVWNGVLAPVDQYPFHERLVRQWIVVPGAETERLGRLAPGWAVVLSIGVNGRSEASPGQLWNSNLVSGRPGRLVNHRRELVATWYERLAWSHGDAHDLVPAGLDGWRLGALICGENTQHPGPVLVARPRGAPARGHLPALLAVRGRAVRHLPVRGGHPPAYAAAVRSRYRP
jgi:nitrilase